uniref:Uncharacterized protein n=1 Tax=Spongospora subterranea TaxID=70186 RepID=A0A0H5RBN4_9EUKA|eukprot:CRZ11438.1 hypothetical protein [Spongospora subterranea]
MSKIKECLQKWEEKHAMKASEAKVVKLMCQIPPINKMDGKLNDLVNCEHLSLSTNMIDKIFPLPSLSAYYRRAITNRLNKHLPTFNQFHMAAATFLLVDIEL